MVKKVTIIVGSPRKESNTHILVKEARKGLEESNVESEVFFLNDLSIKGCQSCGYCKANDTTDCAVQDDMQRIHKAMETSDGILVASPVYFGDVTAQTKLWEDRLFPYYGPGHNLPGHKKAAFIFTQNTPDGKMFQNNLDWFMGVVKMVGFEPNGYLLASDLMKGVKPMATENPEYMKKAYELGKSLLNG